MISIRNIPNNFELIHTCDSIVKCLLGKMAGLVRSVQNLIVEDREVKGKA